MNRIRYVPISCSFYDVLEAAATLRKTVDIRYLDGDSTKGTLDVILDLYIRDQAEYVRTAQGLEIRLDRLIEVDGFKMTDYC